MVQDRLSAGAPIGEYPAGAKHRFFARLKLPGGNWHEVWADYQSDGSKQTCEVFNRRSGPGEQRLSPQGEWLLPGTAANVAFDAFTATPAEKKPGS